MVVQQKIIIFMLIMVFTAQFSAAAIYKYIDSRGHLHFSNVPVTNRYQFYQSETGESGAKARSVHKLISHYSRLHKLDVDLVRAIIRVESDYNVTAISSRGAMGLMQLHPQTAEDLHVTDPFNPSANIAGGTKYLRMMLDRFDGNVDLALAAYNAGPGSVERYHGVPPFSETKAYLKKVKHYRQVYRRGGS